MTDSNDKKMIERRELVLSLLAGSGYLGLRSFASGLSPHFLLTRKAHGQTRDFNFLVFAENHSGCPINANVPGTYIPGIRHPDVEGFRSPTTALFGDQSLEAATPWTSLPADLRDRLHFFHHQTGSSAHPESALVQTLFGSVKSQAGNAPEMLASAVAQETAQGLGALRSKPISLAGSLSYNRSSQPVISPSNMKTLFGVPLSDVDRRVAQLRDIAVDKIYADLKSNGTPAEKKFLDDQVLSTKQSRDLGEQLGVYLSEVSSNNQIDQLRTAAALFAMKITPVVRVQMHFGGDNHTDVNLDREVQAHRQGTEALTVFWDELKKYGLTDKVTFANLNVFGRTLGFRAGRGRDHNRFHSVMVAFGPKIQGGMSGSVLPNLRASGINSETGSALSTDIRAEETHAAAAKSLMKAVGIDDANIEKRVQGGKSVRSFLKS